MRQHINVSITVLGWGLILLGGVLIGVSVLTRAPDYGSGGLYVGMVGGILTMRSYICCAVRAGRELGLGEREDEWREALSMGREIGRDEARGLTRLR